MFVLSASTFRHSVVVETAAPKSKLGCSCHLPALYPHIDVSPKSHHCLISPEEYADAIYILIANLSASLCPFSTNTKTQTSIAPPAILGSAWWTWLPSGPHRHFSVQPCWNEGLHSKHELTLDDWHGDTNDHRTWMANLTEARGEEKVRCLCTWKMGALDRQGTSATGMWLAVLWDVRWVPELRVERLAQLKEGGVSCLIPALTMNPTLIVQEK